MMSRNRWKRLQLKEAWRYLFSVALIKVPTVSAPGETQRSPTQKWEEDKEQENGILPQGKNRTQAEKKWGFWPIF